MKGSINLNRCRGIAMVEVVMVIVIISIAMVSSLQAFSLLGGRSSDLMLQARTLDLAQIYMDEALSYAFDETTGTGGVPTYTGTCRITDDGEARDAYDDVDDLNDIANENPALVDSSLAAEYSQYRVTVNVACDSSIGMNADGGKRVDIQITDPTGAVSVFSLYKGNY